MRFQMRTLEVGFSAILVRADMISSSIILSLLSVTVDMIFCVKLREQSRLRNYNILLLCCLGRVAARHVPRNGAQNHDGAGRNVRGSPCHEQLIHVQVSWQNFEGHRGRHSVHSGNTLGWKGCSRIAVQASEVICFILDRGRQE